MQQGCAEFRHLARPGHEVAMLRALSDWIESNGGPFSFSFSFQGEEEEYTGALELNPELFEEHRAECHAWAEETWIANDPEERQQWLRAFPFAAVGNGDYLALAENAENAAVLYLSHESGGEKIALSLPHFVRAWERLCYIGPEIWTLEPFIDTSTLSLDPNSDQARDLRRQFKVDEAFAADGDARAR